MELTDNDYLSIFDLELNKFIREHKSDEKIIVLICKKAKMILETSSNFISVKEKDGIHYFWRGIIEIILDEDIKIEDNDFRFITEAEYKRR